MLKDKIAKADEGEEFAKDDKKKQLKIWSWEKKQLREVLSLLENKKTSDINLLKNKKKLYVH